MDNKIYVTEILLFGMVVMLCVTRFDFFILQDGYAKIFLDEDKLPVIGKQSGMYIIQLNIKLKTEKCGKGLPFY